MSLLSDDSILSNVCSISAIEVVEHIHSLLVIVDDVVMSSDEFDFKTGLLTSSCR